MYFQKRNLLISVVLLEAIHSLRLQADGSRKLLSSNIKHNVAKLMILTCASPCMILPMKVVWTWLFPQILLKKTWHHAMMVAWVRQLCGTQVSGHVNRLRFRSFYSNIYEYLKCIKLLLHLNNSLLSRDIFSLLQKRSTVVIFPTLLSRKVLPEPNTVAVNLCKFYCITS